MDGTPPVRVACLGASSTQGDYLKVPYPMHLNERLGRGWEVVNLGINGNRTTDLLRRWHEQVQGQGYRWLVVQGGLNDLPTSITPDASFTNLDTITREAAAEGIHVILMTLWPFKGATYTGFWSPEAETKRLELNRLIRASCAEGNVKCVDLAAPLTSPLDPEALNPAYDQGDHLHPNQAGADLMAQMVESVIADQ